MTDYKQFFMSLLLIGAVSIDKWARLPYRFMSFIVQNRSYEL